MLTKYLFYLLAATTLLGTGVAVGQTITKADLQAAARVLGIRFLDDEEADLMLPDLREQAATLQTIGGAELPNDLSPALVFSPVLRADQLPATTTVTVPTWPTPQAIAALPDTLPDLRWLTVAELAGFLKSGRLTSRTLTEYFIARLRQHDPALHCVITLTEERALAQADRMDAELAAGRYRGPLHGIPYGAKDLLAARGYPTTWGAQPYRDQLIDQDAAVIEQLDSAGAVLVAKLSMGALAWGDVWYGEKTRNPWDPESGSSGSSAGSASAVAAGLVPFAIGTETLGSIVNPAPSAAPPGYGPPSAASAATGPWP